MLIAAYPKNSLYPKLLYKSLSQFGISAIEGHISIKWLIKNRRRVDVVHFHWPAFYYDSRKIARKFLGITKFFCFLSIARILGKKVCWTAHNLFPHHINRPGPLDYLARLIVVSFSNLILAHGDEAKKILCDVFPSAKGKIEVIEHGNYIEYYPNTINPIQARKKLGLNPSTFVYLFFGLCRPYKGLEEAIKAYRQIATHDTILIVAGRFQDMAYRRRIEDKVAVLCKKGFNATLIARSVPDDEVQVFFNAADVVLMPYKRGLTSGVGVLAMSFGVPGIASRMGYFVDLYRDDKVGLLFDPENFIESLVQKMRLIRQESFDSNYIMKKAKEKYSWELTAKIVANRFKGNCASKSHDFWER